MPLIVDKAGKEPKDTLMLTPRTDLTVPPHSCGGKEPPNSCRVSREPRSSKEGGRSGAEHAQSVLPKFTNQPVLRPRGSRVRRGQGRLAELLPPWTWLRGIQSSTGERCQWGSASC